MARGSGVPQQLPPAGGSHRIQLRDIIPHIHGPMLDSCNFCQVEVTRNQVIQHPQLLLVQIILGNGHIPQYRQIAGDCAQAPNSLLRVGTLKNHLGSRVPVGQQNAACSARSERSVQNPCCEDRNPRWWRTDPTPVDTASFPMSGCPGCGPAALSSSCHRRCLSYARHPA